MPRPDLHENPPTDLHPRLVAIWRSAVDATHDFLAPLDRDTIEQALIPDYFPAVHLIVAEVDGETVGFAGVAQDRLEMLFVDDAHRRAGIGTALLAHTVERHGVRFVDVNEQNPQAVAFYERHGFRTTGHSDTDDAGRPYPMLHMERVD